MTARKGEAVARDYNIFHSILKKKIAIMHTFDIELKD